jgi:hypothetical protein
MSVEEEVSHPLAHGSLAFQSRRAFLFH